MVPSWHVRHAELIGLLSAFGGNFPGGLIQRLSYLVERLATKGTPEDVLRPFLVFLRSRRATINDGTQYREAGPTGNVKVEGDTDVVENVELGTAVVPESLADLEDFRVYYLWESSVGLPP